MTNEAQDLAKTAIHHVLNAIANDPRKYYLMGEGTGSWDTLTKAAAAIWERPLDEVRREFHPRKKEYAHYCREIEVHRRLINYCQEHGIIVDNDLRVQVAQGNGNVQIGGSLFVNR